MTTFLNRLKAQGLLEQHPLTIGVVGSRKMNKDDDLGGGLWNIFAPHLTIYGFDADEDACQEAEESLKMRGVNWIEKHLPLALSNQVGEQTLYVTKFLDCTSLYPPNHSYTDRFHTFKQALEMDFTFPLEVTTLDAFCQEEKLEEIDFLHVDVQGADLDVLRGASELLERSILGIIIEVEFSPLYVNQPLFSDIDVNLREQGFRLFDLNTSHPACRVHRWDSPIYSSLKKGQLLWADAYYLRDPLLKNCPSFLQQPQQIFKLACIADALDFPDYALELLAHLTIHYPDSPLYNFANLIWDTLAEIPVLVEQGLNTLPVVEKLQPFLR